MKTYRKFHFLLLLSLLLPGLALSQPSTTGQTGLINMPDARIDPDGTWRIGVSKADPYLAGWTSISILPFLEVSGRYTNIKGTSSYFQSNYWKNYGEYKDKTFDAKLVLLKESDYVPNLAVGIQDFQGTGIFNARYLAASKRFANLDVTLGSGNNRIDGMFGGVRYYPERWKNIALVAEYDAYDYRKDIYSQASGAAQHKKGAAYGIEYRWGWLGLQVSYQHGDIGLNGYVAIPLGEKEYVPKLHEPEPYVKISPRPTIKQWNAEIEHRRRIVEALYQQDFKNISLQMNDGVIDVTLTNTRISEMSRAVGRAVRTVLLNAPIETRAIHITYEVNDLPVASYTFADTARLQRYFNGQISRKELAQYVTVDYAAPVSAVGRDAISDIPSANDETQSQSSVLYNDGGDAIAFQQDDTDLNKFRMVPKLALYLNDPSGAFRYDIYARSSYDRHLADRLFLNLAADITLLEDVSKVSNPSNSLLPHVRTDVAEYKRGNWAKLNRALLNKYYQPAERIYARASAGIYEEMFAGAGGQVLYQPYRSSWAADLTVDWLKQRDFSGGLGFRDYSTTTMLGALHYRFPLGMTVTLRGGKFLAQDKGVRVEVKRRFTSGFELGAWYTRTNGNDITSPGAPGNPYYDKGVFMSMPLSTMLTRDTQSRAFFGIAPWTRDVGQMVASPGDLHDMLELQYLNLHDRDGLVRFGDVDDDYSPASQNNFVFERP